MSLHFYACTNAMFGLCFLCIYVALPLVEDELMFSVGQIFWSAFQVCVIFACVALMLYDSQLVNFVFVALEISMLPFSGLAYSPGSFPFAIVSCCMLLSIKRTNVRISITTCTGTGAGTGTNTGTPKSSENAEAATSLTGGTTTVYVFPYEGLLAITFSSSLLYLGADLFSLPISPEDSAVVNMLYGLGLFDVPSVVPPQTMASMPTIVYVVLWCIVPNLMVANFALIYLKATSPLKLLQQAIGASGALFFFLFTDLYVYTYGRGYYTDFKPMTARFEAVAWQLHIILCSYQIRKCKAWLPNAASSIAGVLHTTLILPAANSIIMLLSWALPHMCSIPVCMSAAHALGGGWLTRWYLSYALLTPMCLIMSYCWINGEAGTTVLLNVDRVPKRPVNVLLIPVSSCDLAPRLI